MLLLAVLPTYNPDTGGETGQEQPSLLQLVQYLPLLQHCNEPGNFDENKAPITFGTTKTRIYIDVYDMRISFSDTPILLGTADIKECFFP